MSKLRCLFAGALGAVLVLIAAAVLIPVYGDYRGRAALTEAMGELVSYRTDISERAAKLGKTEGSGIGIVVSPEDLARLGLDYVRIFSDGTIVIRHGQYRQVIVWEPTVSAGEVSWKCVGGPRKSVPPWCR